MRKLIIDIKQIINDDSNLDGKYEIVIDKGGIDTLFYLDKKGLDIFSKDLSNLNKNIKKHLRKLR